MSSISLNCFNKGVFYVLKFKIEIDLKCDTHVYYFPDYLKNDIVMFSNF